MSAYLPPKTNQVGSTFRAYGFACTFVYCLGFCVAVSNAQESLINKLSPAEKAAGWILLFDGIDKEAHWRTGEKGTTNGFSIDDQAMKSANNDSKLLFTRESYDNFEFQFDWKLNQSGNSGVFIRTNPDVGWFCSGTEYAILDEVNGADRNELGHMPGQTTMPIKRSGAAYDMYPTTKNGSNDSPYVALDKPYAQYSHGVIWANGNAIEHWLNGQKVVDFTLGSEDWLTRFKLSKFYNMCPDNRDTYARFPSGLLGFQDHGGNLYVWLRNLKVRPFALGSALPKPWLNLESGNQVVMEAAVTGAEIHYTLDGTTPTATSLLYTQPLVLSANATVKAMSLRKGMAPSGVSELNAVVTALTPPQRTVQRISLSMNLELRRDGLNTTLTLPYFEADTQVQLIDIQGHRLTLQRLRPGAWQWPLGNLRVGHYTVLLISKAQIQSTSLMWLGP